MPALTAVPWRCDLWPGVVRCVGCGWGRYVACPQGVADEQQFVTSVRNAEDKAKAVYAVNAFIVGEGVDCLTSYAALLCYVHFPKCTNDNRILPLCRSTCYNLLRACASDPVTVCDAFIGEAPSNTCTGGAMGRIVGASVWLWCLACTACVARPPRWLRPS